MEWLWLLPPLVLLVISFVLFRRRRGPRLSVEDLQRRFRQQREHLEAAFYTAAAASGKRGGARLARGSGFIRARAPPTAPGSARACA